MVDFQEQADFGESTGSGRGRVIALVALVVLAGVGFGIWYAVTPHTAEEQFAKAEKMEQAYIAESAMLSPADRKQAWAEVEAAYEKVTSGFDASDELTAKTWQRLAELNKFERMEAEARTWWARLTETYPQTPEGRAAFEKLIDSYIAAGRGDLTKDRPAAMRYFEQAVDTCESFIDKFGRSDTDSAKIGMRGCRVLHDDIVDPPIRPIRALKSFLDEYSDSPFADEALYRLAKLHELIAEPATAAEYYTRIIDEHPDSEYLKRAEVGRAQATSEFDAEAGEKLWRELAEKYADDPQINRKATQEADRLTEQIKAAEQAKEALAAEDEAEHRRTERYGGGGGGCGGGGGGGHVDSAWGKPIPPAEMLKDFIAQRVDSVHYRLEMSIDPDQRKLTMTGEVDLVNNGGDKVDFLLMLGSYLTCGDFTLDGKPVEVVRPPGKGDVIHLKLSDTWPAGANATLSFEYSGSVEALEEPEELPEKVLEQFTRRPRAGDWPMVAAEAEEEQDDGEENPGGKFTPKGRLSAQLQIQLNEFGYAMCGASWYPLTIFGDLFTADITIRIREDLVVASSGGSVGVPVIENGVSETRWRCEKPHFGLYFAYGPYERRERIVGGLPVSICLAGDQIHKAEAYLDEAEQIVTTYVEMFGDFPFAKLTMVQVPLPSILGGVGPAGLTWLHSSVVRKMDGPPRNLLAHEISHQWWGNKVPICLIDERYSQWLSEGFACYSDAMYTERAEGREAFVANITKMAEVYLKQSATVREEAIVDTFMGQSPLYRVVVYEKGALVLHALRFVVGDETFFAILRVYADRYAFKDNTVDDFRKLAAEIHGENLDWFFDEWLDQPGCPTYDLDVAVTGTADNGDRKTTVRVNQPGRMSRMPVEVLIVDSDGSERRVRVTAAKKENLALQESGTEIVRVKIDPDGWILHRSDDAGDEWNRPGSTVTSSDF